MLPVQVYWRPSASYPTVPYRALRQNSPPRMHDPVEVVVQACWAGGGGGGGGATYVCVGRGVDVGVGVGACVEGVGVGVSTGDTEAVRVESSVADGGVVPLSVLAQPLTARTTMMAATALIDSRTCFDTDRTVIVSLEPP